MKQKQFIDVKIENYLVKNVPIENFVNAMMYMEHYGLSEIEFSELKENEPRFKEYKQRVDDIRIAIEKLAEMEVPKKSLTELLERFYDNHEKASALAKEIDELKK